MEEVRPHTKFRMTNAASSLINTAIESVLVNLFAKAYQITLTSKRVTLMKRDLDALMTIINLDDIRDSMKHLNDYH